MSHRGAGRCAAVLAALVLTPGVVANADEGAERVERLAQGSELTVKALTDTKLQLVRTMDAYNALFPPTARDRQRIYKDLRKELKSADKRLGTLSKRADQVNARADKLFERWASSAAALQDPELRAQSEERLREVRASYAEIRPMGQKVTELCEPFMKSLRREVVELGRDLDPETLIRLQPSAQKLNADAERLVQRIDDRIMAAKARIRHLRS